MHGQGTNWSQPLHSHCWFYHHHPVIKWPFEIQNFSHPQKTLAIIFVHLHSNIDSLVQRNCLVLYFDKEVLIFYNIIYSAVKQRKQCNEWNKHSWERGVVQEICGECSAVVVILWLYGLQTELLFVIDCIVIKFCTYENSEKWVNSFILGISHLINYWNKSFKNLLVFEFFIQILWWI